MADNKSIIKLAAMLGTAKSKRQINNEIKQLEKVINTLHITAVLAKDTSRHQLNQTVRQLEDQLKQIKLQAKFDDKNLKANINKTLNDISYKDIDLAISEGKIRLKVQKIIVNIQNTLRHNPIWVNIELKKDKLDKQLATYMSKKPKTSESNTLVKEIDNLRNKTVNIDNKNAIKDTSNSFRTLKDEAIATEFATISIAEKIKGLIGGITKIGSAFKVANFAKDNFLESLKTLKNNDNILAQISKATDLSKKQLTELSKESFDTASKFGHFSGDYLLGVQQMAQSGYKSMSKEMAKLSLLAQSAGNMTADIANSYIIATDQSYKYEGNIHSLNTVLDGQNQIAKANCIALKDIAEGMVMAGTVASDYNVTVEDLSAMIGTIGSITKSGGNEIGSAVINILNSLQNLESNQITDTLSKSMVSMTEVTNGTEKLRNPISIIRDLAMAFNQLDDNNPSKKEILTNIVEENQIENFAALLQNMDLFDKMLEDYSNGQGSTLAQVDKSANSLEGCLITLTNSWDELINSITNKSSLKNGASFLDAILNSATKLIETFDVIPVALAGITATMVAKNKDYGLQISNDKGNFDLNGKLFGVNITQIKHFRDAKKAIDNWNRMLAGDIDLTTFENETGQITAKLREYLKTCSSEAPASLKDYKASLRAAGIETNSLRLKTILLNTIIGFGFGIAIQNAVSLISSITQKTNNLRTMASELGTEFANTSSDIDNYKTKIAELLEIINDSSASIDDVTEARRKLMDIQTELIKKYGTEKEKVYAITTAINGQVSALEKLKKAEWYDTKATYNSKTYDDHIIDFVTKRIPYSVEKMMLLGDDGKLELPKSNLQDMHDEWENQSYLLETTGNKKLDDLLSQSFFMPIVNGKFELSGTVDNLHQKLRAIQEIVKNYNVSSSFEDSIATISENIQTIYEKNLNMRRQSAFFDKILSDDPSNVYDEAYDNLEKLKSAYDEAVLEGDKNKIQNTTQAYAQELSNAVKLAIENGDEDVAEYFNNMYPELQKATGTWQFGINFKNNTNGLGDQVKNSLKTLKDFSIEDLNQFNANTATDKQIDAYSVLLRTAESYDITIQQLLDYLQKLDLIQSNAYKELSKRFGEENIKKLTADDLEIAYNINNSDNMSFKELKSAIQEKKQAAKKANLIPFTKAWENTKTETKQELLELAKAGEISEETLKSTEKYNHLLSQTGMSAKHVKDNITNMLTTQQKLSAFSNGMSSLQSAYQEFQNKKFVTASTLDSLPDIFKRMNGGKDFDLFSQIVGDPSNGNKKIKDAFNNLVAAYLKHQNTLVGVTKKNKNTVIANLNDAGVSNAAEVVNSYINNVNRIKTIMAQAQAELENKSAEERQADLNNFQELLKKKDISFAEACNALGEKNAILMQLLGKQYTKDYLEWTNLLSNKILAYNKMIEAINAAGDLDDLFNAPYANVSIAFKAKYKVSPEEYIAEHNPLKLSPTELSTKSNPILNEALAIVNAKNAEKREQAQNKKLKKPLKRIKVPDFRGITYDGSSSNNGEKMQPEKSYQFIDWIARKLEMLQSKIDLTKAKFENLFTLKSKKSNLSTQILQTIKLLKSQEKAAEKYQKVANKYAKKNKLSKDAIQKVEKGSLNIKKYESNIASIIQTYQDYYDQAKAAKKAAIEAKKALLELKKEQNQLQIDYADKKLSAIDAQVENQKTAYAQNNYLQKKVEWIKKYYNYQIKNAKLDKDATKMAELRAQKKKALRDIKIQKNQNLADVRETHYNLNQKRAENATDAKTKNKYEETSLQNIKDKYKWEKKNAEIEHGKKSAEYKLLQEEENAEIRAAYKRMYDNIKTEYENYANLSDAHISTVKAQIAALETAGKSSSKALYEDMIKSAEEQQKLLNTEYAMLQSQAQNFEYGSEEWYAWKNDLESIKQSLSSSKQSVVEFQKEINKLDFKKFSLIASQLNATKSHLDFLTGMLSHQDLTSKESGGLTDAGLATISLRFSNIDTQNKIIENARMKLKELYEKHQNGTDFLSEEEFMEATEEEIDIIKNGLEAIADEKDAILDLVNNAMQVQIDSINELIDKKKKALATEKDLYEYQKKVTKQTKNIALIQKQIAALSGDHSEEAKSKIQKLKISLEEAQEDLKDTEYDKWHSDQENMLDSLSAEVEDFWERIMDDLKKNIDGSLDRLMQMVTDNPDAIARALDALGLGEALSVITKYNGDGTHTIYKTDYNGNIYQSTYQDNTGNNINNPFRTEDKLPDSPVDTNSSSGNPPNTIIETIHPSNDNEINRTPDQIHKNPELTPGLGVIDNESAIHLAEMRAKSIMKQSAEGKKTFVVDYVPIEGVQGAVEKFLNSSALHKPTTEAGKKHMNADPLLKYIAENYSGKTLSNANEALLGAYLGIPVRDKNNVTIEEAKEILKAFKDIISTQGGIASGLDTATIQNSNKDLITVEHGKNLLTAEQAERFQKLAGTPHLLNQITENTPQIPDYAKIAANRTINNPVTVGDVSIHLDGSNVVDKETFRRTLREYDIKSDIEQIALGDVATGSIRNSLRKI